MSNKAPLSISTEELEVRLSRWEKWLYLLLGAAVIMLVQGFITHDENTRLTGLLFSLDAQGLDAWQFMSQYSYQWLPMYVSPWLLILWLVVEVAALVPAAILGLHSHWRRIALSKRLDLLGGFLLVGWLNLLALGAANPLNVSDAYNVLVIVYLLALGGGYWGLKRRQERAEEVFP